ncbi:XRE family transcriptional regulator [Dyadobacter psychrophilus]|uniref:SOS-response transcriptional repressor LexA (RecA-mediated autopeptidase) n=1 Tax=Dyadobacter psychrophilus TaxID=651661 RepID=A0A1T5C8M4_9BACT|nr:LexA family transcriptional regulator [Dyadobacter psychrophilus]SKB55726.1 SOS-response transcriptional repressor LexA (RecA-mediated autopeptidase) [Dyadobacter psychrophilus]
MQIDEEFKRFKQIREELNLTQSAFADELGISATTADIERGRTRIPGQVVKELLKKYHINPLWLFGDSKQKYLQADKLLMSPKVVTVDNAGKDNIVLVSAKAAAGYPNNIGDAQWFESLPAFTIPLPEYRNATFRGFQVEGDSMLPVLHSGEWIVGRALDDWEDVNPKQIYVVVTVDSILVKKIRQESGSTFVDLISSNSEYSPIRLDRNEIKEIWIVNSKLTFDLEADNQPVSLLSLHSEMKELKEEMKKLVKDVVLK